MIHIYTIPAGTQARRLPVRTTRIPARATALAALVPARPPPVIHKSVETVAVLNFRDRAEELFPSRLLFGSLTLLFNDALVLQGNHQIKRVRLRIFVIFCQSSQHQRDGSAIF